MSEKTRPHVVVLFGGQSGEHQISCATAGGVLRAIDPKDWRVTAVGIAPSGQWVPMPVSPEEYALGEDEGYTVPLKNRRVAFLPGSPTLIEYQVGEGEDPIPGTTTTLGEVDVVFPLLHGPFGEDGTVQGLFELSRVRYVGCGVTASAVAQDKYLAKTVLGSARIDVGRWVSFSASQWAENQAGLAAQVSDLGYPVFVKPTRAGSSLGITRVETGAGLADAVEEAQRHDPRVIVEAELTGREVECGVLGLADGTIVASEIGEIRVLDTSFYDYESKYFSPDSVALECPAQLPAGVSERIQREAKRAFIALEGEGISRVDFFYDEQTDRLALNEVNTMPGFTPFSMYPRMFAEAGYSYPQLVDALLKEAMGRPLGLR